MINSLKEAFPTIETNGCIEFLSDREFEIYDDEEDKRCYISSSGQFKVENPHQKEIGFLAVDACIFSSYDASRCDCIIFTDESFCFIELKSCKNKNESSNRQKAKKQLKTTIELFKSKVVFETQLEAYICITCTPMRKIPRASNMDAIAEFEEFLDTHLEYSCIKVF